MGQQEAPCCSKWKQPTKMPEFHKMAEHAEMATSDHESETTTTQSTQNEQNQREMTNQEEMAGTNEQAKKEQTTPLASLKQKMQKRHLAERHKKTTTKTLD